MNASRERGFTLVEVMFAMAVLSVAIGGVLGAMLAAPRAEDRMRETLTAVARTVLTDLRAQVAYDPNALALLNQQGRRTFVFAAAQPGGTPLPLEINAEVRACDAHITVATVTGTTETVQIEGSPLRVQAPSPGTTLVPNAAASPRAECPQDLAPEAAPSFPPAPPTPFPDPPRDPREPPPGRCHCW